MPGGRFHLVNQFRHDLLGDYFDKCNFKVCPDMSMWHPQYSRSPPSEEHGGRQVPSYRPPTVRAPPQAVLVSKEEKYRIEKFNQAK